MKEFLDSDRVNFLVWRYLLEGNYRETAAKFQKEWRVKEPHRSFDFAPHVKSHALVSVVNRGLLYYSLERDYVSSKSQTTEGQIEPLGVFGPLITEPPPQHSVEIREEDDAETKATVALAAASDPDGTRKRHVDKQHSHMPNGSPAKRPRLGSGYEGPGGGGSGSAVGSGGGDAAPPTPMDIDSNENQHAYPSPMERESAPTPGPRTDGPEQGTQIDKVQELTPETIFLRLAPDQATDSNSLTEPLQPGHDNPIVLHCEWNPVNPSILAASGTDALARIWTVSRATAADHVGAYVNGVNRPYKDLVDGDVPRSSTVTTMAWNPDGTAIAIATETGTKARVSVWAIDGTVIVRFNVQEAPVIKLRWNPRGSALLGIGPDTGGMLVTVYSAVTSNSVSYFLPDHELHADLDAAWVNEDEFLLCSGDVLLALRCSDSGVEVSRRFDTKKDDSFVQIQYDRRSKMIATGNEKGLLDLWNEAGDRRVISAHIGLITSLMWQPLESTPPDDERLLASGGEDGAITIWNARLPDSKPKCSMTMDLPVVALAFTPDGAFIAGATAEHILIWKVGDHAIPRASWSRTPHPGWLCPKTNGDGEEEDLHCLCWDMTGQKLAYGVNNRLAVINFR